MNILIVSGFFYPTNTPRAFRTAELAKQFVRLGHKVTVCVPESNFDYSVFLSSHPMVIKTYKKKLGRRVFTGVSLIDRAIFRAMNQFLDYPDKSLFKILYKVLKKESGYDLLISIAVPHEIHWAIGRMYREGLRVAKTWVADCGDPFMLRESGNFKPMFYFKRYEKLWCKFCDYIAVPTEASKDGYYPEFRSKIRVIPQAFNFDEIETLPFKPNKIPTFAFTGSFIPGLRDPRPILDYLTKSKNKFKAIFYTRQPSFFSAYKNNEDHQIIVKEYIPRLDLLKELSQMDFLLNIANGNVTCQTPSKLIDYALVNRPILTVSSLSVDTSLLDEFLNGDYSRQYIVPNLEQYDIKNVANQFLSLV